ncbi:MAG: hypothetical protein GYB24_14160 [Rhodobacteraceae bacterium]|nr:hypothetical protein [Paracoccaceae bacterium]
MPVPRARVNATNQVVGETIAIEEGHGHHGHNWGNAGSEVFSRRGTGAVRNAEISR